MKKALLFFALVIQCALAASAQIAVPIKQGPTLPATCSTTNVRTALFYKTGSSNGLYYCSAANTWTADGSTGGTGAVVGPASATDLAVAIFNGTTGKIVKNSLVTISATGEILMPGGVALKMGGAPVLWDDGAEVLVGGYSLNRPLWFYAQQVNVGRWLSNGQLNMVYPLSWGATIGTEDTGIGRFSAGVLKSTNGSTAITSLVGGGGAVASASALPLPTGNVFHVTGTNSITSITSTNFASGVQITMIFDGALTVTNGGNMKLSANFVTTPLDTLTLIYDGTNWHEVARSVNA